MSEYLTRARSKLIQETIRDIFVEQNPKLTVRQIYYALTVRGVIPKTENGYHQVCYHLRVMRERDFIPYWWIADNTRYHLKPQTDRGLVAAVERWQESYRRDLWANQPDYVEIWVEKDALAGVISPVTQEYDVPLYVARGYSSMTFLYDAAASLKNIGKPAYIYHFGDYDPSGVDAANKIKEGLLRYGANIHFERIAVTPEQIVAFNLPTRETKQTDPRAKKWGHKPSVELDALSAPVLRELVGRCIKRHVDTALLATTLLAEQLERNTLEEMVKNFVLVRNSYDDGEVSNA
jgi:hypothetical protein